MKGYLSILLHAHLPFVRHPERDRFFEESWLFEAISETYLPLIQVIEGWWRDGVEGPLTINLSPTLGSMLADPLLQRRFERYLERFSELTEKEIGRTSHDRRLAPLARFYRDRIRQAAETYHRYEGDLIGAFRLFQERGQIELIGSAATHPILPLLGDSRSIRAQVLIGRDWYRHCFGSAPYGFWLPECGYSEKVEPALREAGVAWFVVDTHGIRFARPRPRNGEFAPLFTPEGLAAFGRDAATAHQVWSRQAGYPGDPAYRDFYRDIGYDLDEASIRRYWPDGAHRGFTGIKYHRIQETADGKEVYDRQAALQRVEAHANDFIRTRMAQGFYLHGALTEPALIVAPFDAELFGHWWFEGPEFLDTVVRKADREQRVFELTTPTRYLYRHPEHQVARPHPSSWGEGGYWKVWLDESNEWALRHVHAAEEQMNALARRFGHHGGVTGRAVRQAARELLLAQASDWPFHLYAGDRGYAAGRLRDHLERFARLQEMLDKDRLDESEVSRFEATDNLFPDLDPSYWANDKSQARESQGGDR